MSRTGSLIHTEDFRSSAAPATVKDKFSNSHRRLWFQRCSINCQGLVLQFTPKTFAPALLHLLSRTGSPIQTEDYRSSAAPPTVKDTVSNSHRKLSLQRQVLQFTPKTFRSSAAPPTVKDRFSNSHRRLSLQRCSTNCQGHVLQFTPRTFAPALRHQLSKTGFPIRSEDFRSSAAPPTVKNRFSNSHRRLSFQRCSTNCQGKVFQFTPKTFAPALLHQLSRTGFPIHTEDFRSSAAPPPVKNKFSNSHRSLPLQRCSTTCQGQVLQFTPKTFAPALLHQLSRTGSPILTEDFRSSAAPPTVKDRFSNTHRRLSSQRYSTNCQRQVLQFTPKAFAPTLLHQLSRTGSPIHTEDFRSSAAPPTIKERFSNFFRRHFVPLLESRTGSPIRTEDFRPSAAPPTVKDMFSNSHRRLSFQRWSTNCRRQVLQFTPKTFVPALFHQLSKTGSPIHTEDFRSSVAPPTVKDEFSNSHRRPSFHRCSTNCQGRDLEFTPNTIVPALLHQLSWTGSPIHTDDLRSSAAPPIVNDRFSDSHRRLSLQRCSTNCQRQVLQFTPKFFVPALPHQLSRTGSPIHKKTFVPALLHQLSRTGSPIHTEDFRSSAAPPIVKDMFSNSHRRLSLQRCSTNCQGQVLQFTPKTFVPALRHQLSRAGSPIHTEDFRSSAAPPTVKDMFSNLHRRLSLQRCSTNCQGQVLQFTPKTFAPALLHQLSRTGSPIHTENFRSSAAPPTVKDRFSNTHRRLSFQRCSTNCQGQVLQFTTKTFVPALTPPTVKDRFSNSHRVRSSAAPPTVRFSNSHRKLSFQRCIHQLSRTGSPIHTEELSLQRCSTNCQGQVLQFTPKTFVPALLHQLSRTGSPIHTEDFRSCAAPPTVEDRISNSHRRLSFQRCSTDCQGKVFQFTPRTFVPALLHQLSRTGSPIHTENFRSSAAPPTVKDKFSDSHRRLFVPALLHQLSKTSSPIHTKDFRSNASPPTVKDSISN